MPFDEDQWRLERAKIAVEEYKVLHAEILQRNTVFNQVTAALVGALIANATIWLNGQLSNAAAAVLLLLIVITFSLALFLVHGDAVKASGRIIEIEKYVNGLVGGDDLNPLSWERRFGITARTEVDRFKGK